MHIRICDIKRLSFSLERVETIVETRWSRWPWVAQLNFETAIAIFFVTFREEFTRISLCLYSASSPYLLMPCLLTDQNFENNL